MTRFAAVDIGTNSVLLTVADFVDGVFVTVEEHAVITRLGRGVDRTRALQEDAVRETLACLEGYRARGNQLGVTRWAAAGTSALRDAAGGDDFRERAAQALGVAPMVVHGAEEASLTFFGALTALSLPPGHAVTVLDVGGGSTEFASGFIGCQGPELRSTESLDVGAVRLAERVSAADPPGAAYVEQLRDAAQSVLRGLTGQSERGTLVAAGGTVTTLAALELHLAVFDAARVHGYTLSLSAVDDWAFRFAELTSAARREVPGLDQKRSDVIIAGAVVLAESLRKCGADRVLVSTRGVRWGLLQRMVPGVR